MKKEIDYNTIISKRSSEKSAQIIGAPDILIIPDSLITIQNSWGSLFLAQNYTKIDTFVIFVHGGIRVPTGFEQLITLDTLEDIERVAETIHLNADLGSATMASNFLMQLNDNPQIAVIWYDFTRIVGDANRSELAAQVPDLPYKGDSPWTNDAATLSSRKPILQAALYPFFEDLTLLLSKFQPTLITYPHTYDQTSGGTTTEGATDVLPSGKMRPAGMIFHKNHSIQSSEDSLFFPKEVLPIIQEFYYKTLANLSTLNEIIEIGIDYPYLAATGLPVWIDTFYQAHHVMFEVRKDIFAHISEKDLDNLTQFILKTRNILLK